MTTEDGGAIQIPLAFSKYEQIDFDLYEPGRNRSALDHLSAIPGGEDRRNVYLWGQTGTGKSHLLQALCTAVAGDRLATAYVPLAEAATLSPDMLDGLESLNLVCLDDINAIAGDRHWEEAVFHLFNSLRDADVTLVMTADQGPRGIPIDLPDLGSRLGWDHVFHLLPLGQTDALNALQKRARSRGFDLTDDVADFLIKRVARDMHSLFALLDRLDRESLVAKKKLTIPFVRELLEEQK